MNRLEPYIYVTIQFTLLIAIVLLPGEPTTPVLQIIGLLLIGAGLIISFIAVWQLRKHSLTALPTPIKNAKLLTSGLYAYARHPIYTGLILPMSGVIMSRFSLLRLLLLVSLVMLLYQKSKYEEAQLTEFFGKKYTDYIAKTGRFISMKNKTS